MRKRRIDSKTVLLLFCLVWLSTQAVFGETLKKLVAVTEVWPPFRVNDASGKYGFTGIDVELMERLEEHLGLEIEIQRHPFARALEMIRNGTADLIPGVAYTDKRNEFILYVPTSYCEVKPVFYTQKGRGHLIRKYEDLYTVSVGYSLHSAYFEPFNSDTRIKKVGVSTEAQLLKMVSLKRIDVTIGTNPNIAYDVKRLGLKEQLEPTFYIPEQQTPIFFGLSRVKNDLQLREQIDQYFRQSIKNGKITQLMDKYR